MRSFIGIPLNNTAQNEIFKVYPKIKDLRYTKKENLHITVKFLGEVKEENIEKIKKVIEDSCNNIEKFEISCNRLSSFPTLTSAKVIWVNVDDGAKIIEKIYDKLENKFVEAGFMKENRKFIPHITIARAGNTVDITGYLRKFDIKSIAESIVLYRSDLKPNGPIYTKVFEFNFKG